MDQSLKPTNLVPVGDVVIGRDFALIAGPCAVESESQTMRIAFSVRQAGANIFRAGAFKPRTSPKSFQGLGMEGLKILDRVRRETGLVVVTEVLDPRDVAWVCEYADMVQIGARNMQNFSLLKEIGKTRTPVLLKRGMHATLQEWLQSAAYVLDGGNQLVVLCERGIRTIETYTRNTLDLTAVPAIKELSAYPIVVDPAHATGKQSLILPMALSGVAAGADGIMVEVHHQPQEALCDKEQALTPAQFERLAEKSLSLRAFLLSQRDGVNSKASDQVNESTARVDCTDTSGGTI